MNKNDIIKIINLFKKDDFEQLSNSELELLQKKINSQIYKFKLTTRINGSLSEVDWKSTTTLYDYYVIKHLKKASHIYTLSQLEEKIPV